MFGHLEDPQPPGGQRWYDAVLARATRLRRLRYGAIGAGSVALATTFVIALVVLLPSRGGSADLVTIGPSPSTSDNASPVGSSPPATDTPAAIPTVQQTGSAIPAGTSNSPRSPSESPSPSASPTCDGQPEDCPDGKPGWGSGSDDGCQVGEPLPTSTAPYPDLTLSLAVDTSSASSGSKITATATITNNGAVHRQFTVTAEDWVEQGGLIDNNPNVVTSRHKNGEAAGQGWDVSLDPGQSMDIPVIFYARSCGDTFADPEPPISAGRYGVVAMLDWAHGGASTWVSDPVTMTITG